MKNVCRTSCSDFHILSIALKIISADKFQNKLYSHVRGIGKSSEWIFVVLISDSRRNEMRKLFLILTFIIVTLYHKISQDFLNPVVLWNFSLLFFIRFCLYNVHLKDIIVYVSTCWKYR